MEALLEDCCDCASRLESVGVTAHCPICSAQFVIYGLPQPVAPSKGEASYELQFWPCHVDLTLYQFASAHHCVQLTPPSILFFCCAQDINSAEILDGIFQSPFADVFGVLLL